jgi:peroxiredoxin
MRIPRLSANGWLLVIFAFIIMAMAGEPAYRAITGRKSALQLRLEHQAELVAKYQAGPQVGDVAPPFTLKSMTDGRKVSLSDFRGRRVLINFFCGCSLCREFASHWAKLQQKPLKGNPVFIGVCFFEPDRLPMFVKATGAKNMIYLSDPGPPHQVGIRYGSRVCPRAWVIDENGKIAFRHEEMEANMPHSAVPAKIEAVLEQPHLQIASAR